MFIINYLFFFCFVREILENSATSETNESLKNAFDRIVALPLRSALNPNKFIKDFTPRDTNNTTRPDRTLTLYEKYKNKFLCLGFEKNQIFLLDIVY